MASIPNNKKYLLVVDPSNEVRYASDELRELHSFAVMDARLDGQNHTYHLYNKSKTKSITFKTNGCAYWQ